MLIKRGDATLEVTSQSKWVSPNGTHVIHQDIVLCRGDDFCKVTLDTIDGDTRISSYGGTVWPGSFPEFCHHVGPDAFISYRSGPQMLPEIVAEIVS